MTAQFARHDCSAPDSAATAFESCLAAANHLRVVTGCQYSLMCHLPVIGFGEAASGSLAASKMESQSFGFKIEYLIFGRCNYSIPYQNSAYSNYWQNTAMPFHFSAAFENDWLPIESLLARHCFVRHYYFAILAIDSIASIGNSTFSAKKHHSSRAARYSKPHFNNSQNYYYYINFDS